MNANPWIHVPASKPFVLGSDKSLVEEFNKDAGENRFLRVCDLLPEPFIGDPKAPVLLLSNNPGFGKAWKDRADPDFMKKVRLNLHHRLADCPFYYLGERVGNANRAWWERRVKCLIAAFDREVVARSILNVTFFPYPSKRFGHDRLELESQKYGFQLVSDAMSRGAFIVFMRKKERWLDKVPGLKVYERACQVNNVQNPTVSPKNLRDYSKVVDAIAAAVGKGKSGSKRG